MVYLCQRDPYLTRITTEVISCSPYNGENKVTNKESKVTSKVSSEESYIVELKDSMFFPEGGGQSTDLGKIGDAKVLWVFRQPGKILHQTDIPLKVGSQVECTLDWNRRYDHMQQHSGQHLLSAILDHYHIPTLSWELGSVNCNIDIEAKMNLFDAKFMEKIEKEINEKIRQALPVILHEYRADDLDSLIAQGKLRGKPSNKMDINGSSLLSFIEIIDTDFNMCCGTHVRSLAELQAVKLLFVEPMRGNVRLHFICGQRVLNRFSDFFQYEKELVKLLKCAPKEHYSLIENYIKTLKSHEKFKSNLLREIAKNDAVTIASDNKKFVFVHKEDYDNTYLNTLMKELNEIDKIVFAVCGPKSGKSGIFSVKAPEKFFIENEQMILNTLAAKGKARNGVLQGKADNLSAVTTLKAQLEKMSI